MSDSSWVSYIKFIDWSWVLTFIFSSLVYGVEIFFSLFFDGFWLSLSLGTRFWWAFYFGFWFEKGRVLSVKRFIDLLRDLLRHYWYVF